MIDIMIAEAIARHDNVAFEFSGGKDSVATFLLLEPYLDSVTVYHLDTLDQLPETMLFVQGFENKCKSFVRIESSSIERMNTHGLVSDLVTAGSNPFGLQVGHNEPLLQSRYECCFNVIMKPMHDKVIEDGNTLIIRGQKNSDTLKGGLKSGATENGIEYLYPIEDWSDEQVFDFIKSNGIELPKYYETMSGAIDCAHCTAYWGDGRIEYLKSNYPSIYQSVLSRMDIIKGAVAPYVERFNQEVSHG